MHDTDEKLYSKVKTLTIMIAKENDVYRKNNCESRVSFTQNCHEKNSRMCLLTLTDH